MGRRLRPRRALQYGQSLVQWWHPTTRHIFQLHTLQGQQQRSSACPDPPRKRQPDSRPDVKHQSIAQSCDPGASRIQKGSSIDPDGGHAARSNRLDRTASRVRTTQENNGQTSTPASILCASAREIKPGEGQTAEECEEGQVIVPAVHEEEEGRVIYSEVDDAGLGPDVLWQWWCWVCGLAGPQTSKEARPKCQSSNNRWTSKVT